MKKTSGTFLQLENNPVVTKTDCKLNDDNRLDKITLGMMQFEDSDGVEEWCVSMK